MFVLFWALFDRFNGQIHKFQKSREITRLALFDQKKYFFKKLLRALINHLKTAYKSF